MTARERLTSVLAPRLVRALGGTWRLRVSNARHVETLRARGEAFAFALWHAHMLPLIWHHRGDATVLVVSEHRDGGYLARAAAGLGYGVVRGSSTRGGVRALRTMVRVLRAGGEVAVTTDGPRGPAQMVKPGVAAAARWADATILPVAAAASSAWRLRSWDRLEIPKPFATIHVVYGPPLRARDWRSTGELREGLEDRLRSVSACAAC